MKTISITDEAAEEWAAREHKKLSDLDVSGMYDEMQDDSAD